MNTTSTLNTIKTVRASLARVFEQKSWHPTVVQSLAELSQAKTYLEVGIYRGETLKLLAKTCERVIGLDIDPGALASIPANPRITLHLQTAQEFALKNPLLRFDLVFIDADHRKQSVLDDFYAVESLVNESGIVAFHDTWPKNLEFSSPHLCGDAYKAIPELRRRESAWNFITFRKHPGLTIAQKSGASPDWA